MPAGFVRLTRRSLVLARPPALCPDDAAVLGFIWRSIRERMPIGDASQCDIAWHWFKPEFQQASRQEAPERAAVMPRGDEREA